MLEVKGLKKTFKMSKKQQKIEKTKEKIKVAVADVSLMRVREKSLESLAQTAPEKPQRSEF